MEDGKPVAILNRLNVIDLLPPERGRDEKGEKERGRELEGGRERGERGERQKEREGEREVN